jgi:RimJ/RimL family protein N-acetyltransferase
LTVEDLEGNIRGFCTLRGADQELAYGELVLMLFDEPDYDSPLADEVFEFLRKSAFQQKKLNKVVTYCLDGETAYRSLLIRKGFQSDGVQREIVFALGRWHNLESLSLFLIPPAGDGHGA